MEFNKRRFSPQITHFDVIDSTILIEKSGSGDEQQTIVRTSRRACLY